MRSTKYYPPKPAKIDEALATEAETHLAKAAGLLAGVSKLIGDFISGTSWGDDITIDAAIQLLEQAKMERKTGISLLRDAKRKVNP